MGSSGARFGLSMLIAACVSAQVYAQKAPELGYAFPPAIQAGSQVDVQLGGFDFTPDMQFFAHDPLIDLEVLGKPGDFIIPPPPYWFGEKARGTAFPIPREVSARIRTASDARPGLRRWQVANANGSSPTAVIYVSDTREIVENRYRDQPQMLEQLPVGVSGRLERIAEVDRYRVVVKRDGPISVELFARRLGAAMNGMLRVRNATGQVIADMADTQGIDTALTFFAKSNDAYTIELNDLDFRGNRAFVYRLAVTPGPRIVTTKPAAGRRGEKQAVEFFGFGVASGKPQFESTTRTITFPNDAAPSYRYRLETPHGHSAAYEIPLSDIPESPAGADSKSPHRLTIPCAVTATLPAIGKGAYAFSAKKGELYALAAQSRRIGTRLDLEIRIHDAEGKQLATNDDVGGSPDAGLEFRAPADGDYTCIVRDLSGRNPGPESIYRLAVELRKPSFRLSAPQQFSIPVAGKAELPVTATRFGGHKAAIKITVEGLPPGVTATEGLSIAEGKKQVKLPLQAAAEAAATAGLIRITGEAADGEIQTVLADAAGNLCPQDVESEKVSRVMLTTTMKPAFSLELIDKNRQRAVHRGTTYPAPFIIKRDEGFDGEILLQMAARQGRHRQGIYGPTITVANGVDRVLYPSFMPEWLETDRTTRMVVLGVGKQKDPQGNIRYIAKPAAARITMILEGALLRVAHQAGELTVDAGKSFEIPVTVSRSAKLAEPVTIQLVTPAELKDLVRCDPPAITLAPEDSEVKLRVTTVRDTRLFGRWNLQIKAKAMQDGKWMVLSQTEVAVEFSASAASASGD